MIRVQQVCLPQSSNRTVHKASNMKILCNVCFALAALSACDSSTSDPTIPVSIGYPLADRQIQSIDNSILQIQVVVNGGAAQLFNIDSSAPTATIDVRGILIGQSNTIQITWTENLNGFEIELARQEQVFLAEGNVVIDAFHDASAFDYDSDGLTNLDERNEGSCVWSATDSCLIEGAADVPSSNQPSMVAEPVQTPVQTTAEEGVFSNPELLLLSDENAVPSVDFINGTNVVSAQDFNNNTGEYVSNDPDGVIIGEYCVQFQPGPVGVQNFLAAHIDTFAATPGNYAFRFDVRSSRTAPVLASITSLVGGSTPLLNQWVRSFTASQTRSIAFTRTGETVTAAVGFSALRADTVTEYCFDNIQLVRVN